jgi:hypothetical protein
VLNKLDGKYMEAGLKMKKEGKTSVDIIKELREDH